jgi:alpha-L-fucosidase
MKGVFLATAAVVLIGAARQSRALEGDPYAGESAERKNARMGWWREAKFGMFIHWGVYAVPAGTHEGGRVNGIGEWIMLNGKIPVERYKSYAKDFNPAGYDPKAWADLAKEAGMRYMVITAKHHDGFALFPSEASAWDVADATPWKKDLLGPLAEAARANGLKFGLYYSQAQDWIHPGGAKYGMKEGEGWDPAHDGPFDAYLDQIAVPQVREILTRYQPDVLWWDTPQLMTPERAAKLAPLLALRPGIIHNNRLGGGYKGDTETPEQHIPATGFPGRDWETCMTMNETWGFKSYDHDWKSSATLVRNLVDIVSKGGNYLLNVGPTAAGVIPPESVRLLHEVGAWMRANGESVHGTSASPFRRLPWGRCTSKPGKDTTTLYLHVFDWPADGRLLVPGLENEIRSAEVLAGNIKVAVTMSDKGPVIGLPAAAPDAVSSTLRLVIAGAPRVSEPLVTPDKDGIIHLTPAEATYQGGLKSQDHEGTANIGFWNNPDDSVSWSLKTSHEGRYEVSIDASSPTAGSVLQVHSVGKLAYSVPQTAGYLDYRTTKVGEITLPKDAKVTLTLRPVADGWKPVNVRKVELLPQP